MTTEEKEKLVKWTYRLIASLFALAVIASWLRACSEVYMQQT